MVSEINMDLVSYPLLVENYEIGFFRIKTKT
jgi:hypothetical protein